MIMYCKMGPSARSQFHALSVAKSRFELRRAPVWHDGNISISVAWLLKNSEIQVYFSCAIYTDQFDSGGSKSVS